ncbi:MAG: 5-oxoprolinase subunit PxpA [Flavobacteriaceae bacterium]|nr:5-oxoprolinase subunit PxpA [Flavobacteriaceae bacterium]
MDINCDLGEGLANDAQIMPYISSCNIACGGHAGNIELIKKTVQLAKKFQVKIGAHPSFVDRENFGRKELYVPKDLLIEQIIDQISVLKRIVEKEGEVLHHVKPHGALYNMAAKDEKIAKSVIEAVQFFDDGLILYVPFRSSIANELIKRNLPFYYELFADRMYLDDLSLMSRKETGSVIENPKRVLKRVKQLIDLGTIKTVQGNNIKIESDTICVHGDNPNAVEIVKSLSTLIKK